MLRKAVCAVAVLAFSIGLAVAAEIRGVITKVSEDGKTITVATRDKETKKLGEGKEYTVASSVKVLKGKFNKEEMKLEAGDEIADGLKSKVFQSSKRGVFAQITTNDEGQVTQILVMERKGKGKRKN